MSAISTHLASGVQRAMNRRTFLRVGGLGLLAAATAAGTSSCARDGLGNSPVGDVPERIIIGVQQHPSCETYARATGMLNELLGVPVTITEFKSGRDMNNAFVSNSIDMGVLGSAPATLTIANRVPVRAVYLHQADGEHNSLVVRKGSGVETVTDLAGKSIATTFASVAHYSLLRCLEYHGVSIEDVTVYDMQPADIYAAWLRGDIDCAYTWNPVLGKCIREGGHILVSGKDMQEIGHMTFNVELVTNAFAERYPEFVAAYIGVVDKAVAMYRENPAPFYEVVGESLGVGTEEAEYEMKGCDFLSAADQFCPAYMGDETSDGDVVRVFQDCAEFLATQQCLLEVPEYDVFVDAVDPSFIQSYLEQEA